jgi:hypothetical protein
MHAICLNFYKKYKKTENPATRGERKLNREKTLVQKSRDCLQLLQGAD